MMGNLGPGHAETQKIQKISKILQDFDYIDYSQTGYIGLSYRDHRKEGVSMNENIRTGMLSVKLTPPSRGISIKSASERMDEAWKNTGRSFTAAGNSIRKAMHESKR